jgi:hypothetical protein
MGLAVVETKWRLVVSRRDENHVRKLRLRKVSRSELSAVPPLSRESKFCQVGDSLSLAENESTGRIRVITCRTRYNVLFDLKQEHHCVRPAHEISAYAEYVRGSPRVELRHLIEISSFGTCMQAIRSRYSQVLSWRSGSLGRARVKKHHSR